MTWANKTAFFLVCTIVVLTTLAYGTVHQPTLALFYVGVAALAVLWAIDGMRSGAIRVSGSWFQIPLLAAAVYGLIQVIPFGSIAAVAGVSGIPRTISLDPSSTQINALHFLALFFFLAVLLVVLDSASRIRKLAALIMIFGTVYAFFAILQSVLSPDKIYGIYAREFATPFGSFVNRHNFAAYMEMTLAIPLGLLFCGAVARDKRLLYVTAVALMGSALLLSGSRGGFVALIAEIALLLILTMRSKSGNIVGAKIVLAVILLAAIIGGSYFVGGESSLTRIAETSVSKDVTTDRAYIWGATLKVIRANFPFGAGLGAFGVAFTPFDEHSGLERVEQAHNDYLQVISDAGLAGAAIGLFFLIAFYKNARAGAAVDNSFRRGIATGSIAGIFAILVHSAFDFVLHTTAISVLFLALIGLLAASRSRYTDDIEDLEPGPSRRRKRGSVSPISSRRKSVAD
ncbi:MAG TPA: O-antigen ligase family protein [Pyrinomonadaceae bacterium]|nr:O-antigen ligase family protein [Pyrinomonadaceae bacterium]